MMIASWNVNSLNVRLTHVLDWLTANQPNILALQETKVTDPNFPIDAFREQGWQVAFSGQKTFNGVAIISREPIQVKSVGFPDWADDQRRVLGAEIGDYFVLVVYVPNGQSVGSEKYQYKLDWLSALKRYLDDLARHYPKVIVLGDFNIAPEDQDVHDPALWDGQVLVSPDERAHWRDLLSIGFTDAFRYINKEQQFTWWDYRQAAFRRNRGLRIDHILISSGLASQLESCWVDESPRKLERPSDHTPIIARLRES